MALEDKELYGADASETIVSGFQASGSDAIFINRKFEVTSGDYAASVYRIAQVPSNYVPYEILINNEALTNVSDVDLGIYETGENGGTVIDADIFLDGADISAGNAIGSEQNGMASLSIDNHGKRMYTLASDYAADRQSYDLAMTINTSASGTGTVMLRAIFVNGL